MLKRKADEIGSLQTNNQELESLTDQGLRNPEVNFSTNCDGISEHPGFITSNGANNDSENDDSSINSEVAAVPTLIDANDSKKKTWTRRPRNWQIIAEHYKNHGLECTMKQFADNLAGYSSSSAYQKLHNWKKELLMKREPKQPPGRVPVYGAEIDLELLEIVKLRLADGQTVDDTKLRETLVSLLAAHGKSEMLIENGGSYVFEHSWAARFWKRHEKAVKEMKINAGDIDVFLAGTAGQGNCVNAVVNQIHSQLQSDEAIAYQSSAVHQLQLDLTGTVGRNNEAIGGTVIADGDGSNQIDGINGDERSSTIIMAGHEQQHAAATTGTAAAPSTITNNRHVLMGKVVSGSGVTKKSWSHRPSNWEMIAECFVSHGLYATLKEYPNELHGFSHSSLYQKLHNWKKDLNAHRIIKAAGAVPKYGVEIDNQLIALVRADLSAGVAVDDALMRELLVELLIKANREDLLCENGGVCTFGHSWATRFWKRHKLPSRVSTGRKRKSHQISGNNNNGSNIGGVGNNMMDGHTSSSSSSSSMRAAAHLAAVFAHHQHPQQQQQFHQHQMNDDDDEDEHNDDILDHTTESGFNYDAAFHSSAMSAMMGNNNSHGNTIELQSHHHHHQQQQLHHNSNSAATDVILMGGISESGGGFYPPSTSARVVDNNTSYIRGMMHNNNTHNNNMDRMLANQNNGSSSRINTLTLGAEEDEDESSEDDGGDD